MPQVLGCFLIDPKLDETSETSKAFENLAPPLILHQLGVAHPPAKKNLTLYSYGQCMGSFYGLLLGVLFGTTVSVNFGG